MASWVMDWQTHDSAYTNLKVNRYRGPSPGVSGRLDAPAAPEGCLRNPGHNTPLCLRRALVPTPVRSALLLCQQHALGFHACRLLLLQLTGASYATSCIRCHRLLHRAQPC
jgi:hypothetical protein